MWYDKELLSKTINQKVTISRRGCLPFSMNQMYPRFMIRRDKIYYYLINGFYDEHEYDLLINLLNNDLIFRDRYCLDKVTAKLQLNSIYGKVDCNEKR